MDLYKETIRDVIQYAKLEEVGRIYDFLAGLNPKFNTICGRIPGQRSLPSLMEVCFEVRLEEDRTNAMGVLTTPVIDSAAFFARETTTASTSQSIGPTASQTKTPPLGAIAQLDGVELIEPTPSTVSDYDPYPVVLPTNQVPWKAYYKRNLIKEVRSPTSQLLAPVQDFKPPRDQGLLHLSSPKGTVRDDQTEINQLSSPKGDQIKEGIFVSQREYTLDLLTKIGLLGCHLADTPIELNCKLGNSDDLVPVDKEQY
ncbi:reverse transcriptase [Cucumis melo var. makuwa]|uniref:Reverse transcriptase n=1 Tax=Cucumis melo var. makuwa TaxID=1194695 RepID=A0A5A7U3G7_CUCMM|nr:reverse transcriptase [Cucumis melo var. makuwa]TYK31558.1 reverse transcriptase [Cucumis melo var. makuwa]